VTDINSVNIHQCYL